MTIKEAFQLLADATKKGMKNPFFIMRSLNQNFSKIADEIQGGGAAENITYDNTDSGLTADDVQKAIDELADDVSNIVNYSTSEKVVGTWIDGSTLYQKTYVINALPSSAGYQDISLGLSNIDIKRSFGDLKWASGSTRPFGATGMDRNNPSTWYPTNQITYSIEENSFIRIIVGTDRSGVSATITIQYTKATT